MDMDNKPLVLDLVSWIAKEPRTYDDVMNAWRTSCPRLQIWEDAVDHGLVQRISDEQDQALVKVTTTGLEFLRDHDRQ